MILVSSVSVGASAQTTVYLAGDSTCANKTADKRPETGWGEMLQQYFDPAKVRIDNQAQNGRSTKSFIAEGRWQAIVDKLKKGDYVLSNSATTMNRKTKARGIPLQKIFEKILSVLFVMSAAKMRI